jgi:IPT/TIG domain
MTNNMKKQYVILFALPLFLAIACDDPQINPEPPGLGTSQTVSISSFYPESGMRGATVAIFGENFGTSISDNYVTLGGMYAEITAVQGGVIVVRIPMNLVDGNYLINLSTKGRTATSINTLNVTGQEN